MDRSIRLVMLLLVAVSAAACAGSARPPAAEPSTGTAEESTRGPMWRAELLRAEDLGRVDEALREGLVAEDAERRRWSFRALGRIGDPSTTSEIVAGFEDSDPAVRAEAIFAAAVAGAAETIAAVAARRTDPDAQVRAAVAVALGWFATPEAASPLFELLADDTDSVRMTACYSAARLPAADDVVDALIELIDDPDGDVAAAALYAVSQLSSRISALGFGARYRAREKLLALAESRDPGVRMLVVEGLYSPLAGTQADTLHAMMLNEDSPALLLAILRSTSFPGAPAFVFHEVLIQHSDNRVVHGAIQGLGRMRGDEVNNLLVNFIVHDSRHWLRAEAIRSLASAGRRTFLGVANGLSKDPHPLIRAATAEALWGSDDAGVAEYAWRLFETDDAWVKLHAIPTMAVVEEPLGEVFGELLRDGNIEQQIQMARAAGYRLDMADRPEADHDEALRLLAKLWKRAREETGSALRLAVIDAAASGRHEAGAALIRRALQVADAGVRRHASAVLRASYGETVDPEPRAEKPLSHYERIVEWASMQHAAVITVERQGFAPGRFTVALDSLHAPMTAYRFAELAAQGHYDNRRIDPVVPGLRLQSGAGGGNRYHGSSWRPEPVVSLFAPGTLGAVSATEGVMLGEWLVTLGARPNYFGRHHAFGRVVQNLEAVAGYVLPIDRVVSVRVYQGDGQEPLAPLR